MPDSGGDALAALAGKAEAATRGPWCWQSTGEKSNDWVVGVAFEDGDPLSGDLEEHETERFLALGEPMDDSWRAEIVEMVCSNWNDMAHLADADYIASFHPGVGLALVKVARAAKDYEASVLHPSDPLCAALADLERVLGTEETQP